MRVGPAAQTATPAAAARPASRRSSSARRWRARATPRRSAALRRRAPVREAPPSDGAAASRFSDAAIHGFARPSARPGMPRSAVLPRDPQPDNRGGRSVAQGPMRAPGSLGPEFCHQALRHEADREPDPARHEDQIIQITEHRHQSGIQVGRAQRIARRPGPRRRWRPGNPGQLPGGERSPAALVTGELRNRTRTAALPFRVSPWTYGSTSPAIRLRRHRERPMPAAL